MSIHQRASQSLLAFWADAGVDTAYGEDAVDRTARAAPPAAGPGQQPETVLSQVRLSGDLQAVDSLDALGMAITNFEGCPLKFQGARQAVFWRGSTAAEVMIIGEAPGADEDV